MGNYHWSAEEDMMLKAWANYENARQLSERLGRTEHAVRSRLTLLKIKKKNVYGPNRTWTEEEVAYLVKKAGKMKTKTLAKKLGKTVMSIRNKAFTLDLSLKPEGHYWSKEDERVLKTMHSEGASWEDIGEALNRTPPACRKKAGDFGLTLGLKRAWSIKEMELMREMRDKGVSYKEIAKALNRTEPSVRKKYERYMTK